MPFEWDVRMGVSQLLGAYKKYGLTLESFIGPQYTRLLHIRESIAAGRLDTQLRRQVPAMES
jgi:hypothetical protein